MKMKEFFFKCRDLKTNEVEMVSINAMDYFMALEMINDILSTTTRALMLENDHR